MIDATQAERRTAITNGCTPKRDDADFILGRLEVQERASYWRLGDWLLRKAPEDSTRLGQHERTESHN